MLLALRGNETPDAARDWLDWHRRFHGASGALILDRCDAEGRGALADAVADLAAEMEIVLVAGEEGSVDDAAPVDFALFELLRHRFLSEARAVAHLSIADLVLEDREGNPFDRAAALQGQALALTGTEVYPWKTEPGAAPAHADHGAVRLHEARQMSSWCVAPAGCPGDAVWRPTRIARMPVARVRPALFRRAMGVRHPDVPLERLVEVRDLIADPDLEAIMAVAFGRVLARPSPSLARPAAPARERVAVVSVMKNEGPFILDWIAHHRTLGIGGFLVYTNDCEDGTERLLDPLGPAGVVRRDNPFRETGGVPQHAAFRAAGDELLVADADWLLTLDVDEYLTIRPGAGRIADLLEARPEMGAISMPWRLFGNADRHGFEDRPVTEQFTFCAPEYAPRPLQAWAFKTLYRNDGTFGRLGVHRPKALDPVRAGRLVWLDGSGRAMPMQMCRGGWRMTADTWGYELAGINHYAVRSAESFLIKRERGRVNHVDRDQGLAYWFRMNHNVTEDRSIRRYDGAVAEERARLAALPGVAEAHEGALDAEGACLVCRSSCAAAVIVRFLC